MTDSNSSSSTGNLDLYTFTDLDQVPRGEGFDVTWAIHNDSDMVWTENDAFVYTDETHPETLPMPHTNLAGRDHFSLGELGLGTEIGPGNTAYLTVSLAAPESAGTYFTGWQMQTVDGRQFGPIAEVRVIVIDPPDKGLGDYSYQPLGYLSSAANRNSLLPGEEFTGTWRLMNNGFTAWEGGFRVVCTAERVNEAVNATSNPMGNQPAYSLWDVAGVQQVKPGETVAVALKFVAPTTPGFYAFHWQMVDPDGVPFGGTRWMSIVVAEATGAAPPAPSLPGGGAGFAYRGPAVSFFTGIHGPADDSRWQDREFQDIMRQLNMPVFFMSHGINPDFANMGDPSRNVVRLVWNPRPVTADEAYVELREDQLRRWWDRGYRRFVFFNEPQLKEVKGISKEGFGVAWQSAEEFAQYLKTCLTRARQDFPGIFLYTTPMTTNTAFDPWRWYSAMWAETKNLVDGWCMHAYSGKNGDADLATREIASEILEVQKRLGLQVPIIVSEASVNRGSDAVQKARVARLLHERLKNAPGIQGVYWFAADWAADQDENHEGWFRNGIARAYLANQV